MAGEWWQLSRTTLFSMLAWCTCCWRIRYSHDCMSIVSQWTGYLLEKSHILTFSDTLPYWRCIDQDQRHRPRIWNLRGIMDSYTSSCGYGVRRLWDLHKLQRFTPWTSQTFWQTQFDSNRNALWRRNLSLRQSARMWWGSTLLRWFCINRIKW